MDLLKFNAQEGAAGWTIFHRRPGRPGAVPAVSTEFSNTAGIHQIYRIKGTRTPRGQPFWGGDFENCAQF
jgi:hypothetical protein